MLLEMMQMKNNSQGFMYVFVGLEEGDLGHVTVMCNSDQKANKVLRLGKAMKNRTVTAKIPGVPTS